MVELIWLSWLHATIDQNLTRFTFLMELVIRNSHLEFRILEQDVVPSKFKVKKLSLSFL